MDVMEQGQVVLFNQKKCAKVLYDGGVVRRLLVNGKEIFTRKLFFVKDGALPDIGKYQLDVYRFSLSSEDRDFWKSSGGVIRFTSVASVDSETVGVPMFRFRIPAGGQVVDMRMFANDYSLSGLKKFMYQTPPIVKSFFSGKSKRVSCHLEGIRASTTGGKRPLTSVTVEFTRKDGSKAMPSYTLRSPSVSQDVVLDNICSIGNSGTDIDIDKGISFVFRGDLTVGKTTTTLSMTSFYLDYTEETV